MTGFYIKCNTGLKWVEKSLQQVIFSYNMANRHPQTTREMWSYVTQDLMSHEKDKNRGLAATDV